MPGNTQTPTAAQQEVDEDIHDLLIIPKSGTLYHAKAGVEKGDQYGYASVNPLPFRDPAYRKAMNIADPRDGLDEPRRGPVFSILPNKPDPSTSQICCFLVNERNARAANVWTAREWSSEPDGKEDGLKAPVPEPSGKLELLVASPSGNVILVSIDESPISGRAGLDPSGVRLDSTAQALNLGTEGEVYLQLRNGLVAGSARYQRTGAVLPLVNVASLIPPEGT